MLEMLIVVCGLPATGKSTLAKHLAIDLGGEILRTDIIRRELFKDASLEEVLESKDPMQYDLERIFDRQEVIPEKYQCMIWRQKEMVYDELLKRVERLLKKGTNVILDGTFYKRNLRDRIYSLSRRMKTRTYLIECRCSETVIKKRVAGRRKIRDEASNVDKMRIYYIVKKAYESPLSDPVPIILFDTYQEKFEIKNSELGDEDLHRIVESIGRFVQRFSTSAPRTLCSS
ncbi:hypothetical protein DRO35_05500 [Candidatus Bathyarchaeota archaeon]|nr:MAG: hypothetical protein DRO35_05500 [Candidatus Bathyarchaeota archaeon]